MQTVYVVMANDFPECVFAKETDAREFCKERMESQAGKIGAYRVIYWRCYEFDVLNEALPKESA